MSNRSFFEKKISNLENRSFLHIFALLKEQKSDRSFCCSNEQQKSDCSVTLLQRAIKRAIAHLPFFKSDWASNRTIPFFENERWVIEQMNEWIAQYLLILIMSNRSFLLFSSLFWVTKRAIAHLLFSKELRRSDCSFALLQRAMKRAITHFCSFHHSFEKRDKKSNRSLALLQSTMKRAIAHLLFFKERLWKRSHNPCFENERLSKWMNELPSICSYW